ncbi:MAG: tRNA (guanine-N1)-methyltransferase [Xanthomarina sp.]|uniref:tRNA (guanine-N1)-methyltransferase n=1 Tax=Xanthomarina sp. TaxID=1931211 RepID=UPI000C6C283D|nr:tRNA (guanine-N1)-methyltransferase [Xanthomarina sp.]MBF62271.1 tRNA (guanine-N1)-methyltransferase [Xanthomarina sp.]HAB27627.1 tRNA (guanine-N1)-methyltransferase [Xanthomarina gelatinilytica]HAI16734.1 tRNA (guanine-N1)-methyltransferase [Xanthomarina gelatinilytica]|tara:strand:- start:869 stop:1498 length:630 start_codon:yes stop_codon:yes gene_type:complete
MKAFNFFTITLILLCSFNTLQAQTETSDEDDKLSLDNSTINNQFEYVLQKSGDFRGTNGSMYEAVKRSMLTTLQAHTNDTLKTLRKDLADTQAMVKTQANEISELKTNLSNTQASLEKTTNEKNNMSLFGLQMSKSSYNVLMWSIIGILLAMLMLFIYKYKNSHVITKEAKKALEEIEVEFEEHRKTALEREQKVRRQLQDELNKQKGI